VLLFLLCNQHSIEEVNDRAGFVAGLKPLRVGKKVTGFELIVSPKQKSAPKCNEGTDRNIQELLDEIAKNFGKLSRTVLENILRSYSHEYIFQKITYTKQHAKKEKSGFYPIAYFISALKNDYKSSEQLIEENKEQREKNEKQQRWQEKLESLHYDLAAWQRNLQAAQSNNNPTLIENSKKIVSQCEKSLEQHLLEKPKIQDNVEAD
jgi:Josephin